MKGMLLTDFCLDFIKAFDHEFYEDGDLVIRSVVSFILLCVFFFLPPRSGFHLHSISIRKELLRKGPGICMLTKLIWVYCSSSRPIHKT